MWALTGDGQADKEMVAERDKRFGVSTAKVQAERVEAIGYQVPQVPPPRSVAFAPGVAGNTAPCLRLDVGERPVDGERVTCATYRMRNVARRGGCRAEGTSKTSVASPAAG